ncbi:hypothetical protein [Streptomyces sp. CBMA123]|uniref:hypothetical protein n=1 Tax=Streptomyces sp. CBMA123 TaxID=1896313 RepID=UPI0016619C38|nr:hypothetical protein [Streptomyces sp. CBMA123]MBD0695875.1 hypothetical protein [Streptomyces sp. CBMA123]
MIIFDTNAVNRIDPRNPRADIVRALRASGQHRVGVTGTILEELVAHKAKDYMAQRDTAASALNSLRETDHPVGVSGQRRTAGLRAGRGRRCGGRRRGPLTCRRGGGAPGSG